RKNGLYQMLATQLKPGWQEAKYIALYAPKKWHGEKGGIQYVAKIKNIQMQQNNEYVHFELEPWKKLDHLIRPVGYGIQTYTITTMSLLKEVQELPELFMKSKEERILWKTLRRFTKQVKVELDHNNLDEASSIKSYYVQDVQIWVDYENGVVMVGRDGRVKEVPLELVVGRGSVLFREVLEVLNVGE
ncbi:restriction endonuclease-like protein, partial [Bacillus sp. HC-TM]